MNPTPDLQLLSAYMDDSLGEPERLALETRMEQEGALCLQLYALRRIREAVKTTAQRYSTPQRLRRRIQALALPAESAPRDRFVLAGLRLFGGQAIAWRPLGVVLSVVTLTLSVVNITVWQPARDERLMQAAVSSHLQATTARPLVDLVSSDRETVQPWLAERLGFVAPAAVPALAGVTLVGARLDGLDGHPVAAVVYRLHDHVVHAFIWPASDDSASVTSAALRGLSVNHWSRGGLRYCLVSDLPQGELLAFAQSLAEADHVQ